MAMVFVITFMTSQSTAIFTGSVQVFGKKCDTLIFALVKASGLCFNGTTALIEGVLLIISVKCKCKKFPCLPLVHFLLSVVSNQCNLSAIAPFQVFMARICNFISV